MRGTARLYTVTDGDKGTPKLLIGCSGTVVDPAGLILTNWHCIGQTDMYGPDDTGLNLQHGDMYDSQGLTVVGFTSDPRQAPQPTYLAQVLQGTPDLDIAVVKIFATIDGSRQLPRPLPVSVVPLGDSDSVNLGDPVYAFGYPGNGGPLITETTGTISGWYKHSPFRPTEGMRNVRRATWTDQTRLYLERRVRDQWSWYTGKATGYAIWQRVFSSGAIAANLAAVALLALHVVFSQVDLPQVGLFTTLAATCLAWMSFRHYGELRDSYAAAAAELESIEKQLASVDSERSFRRCAAEAEDAMAHEDSVWLVRRVLRPVHRSLASIQEGA